MDLFFCELVRVSIQAVTNWSKRKDKPIKFDTPQMKARGIKAKKWDIEFKDYAI